MAVLGCNCEVGLSNTGQTTCTPIAKVARRLILVQMTANDGTDNFISTSDLVNGVLPAAFVTDKINEADASKRWFPTGNIDNVEDVKNDPIFQSLNSGENIFIQDGTRAFTGIIVKESPKYLRQLDSARCVTLGAYVIDIDGKLIGSEAVDGELRPIKINKNTWVTTLNKATDTTVQDVGISFEWDRSEYDGNLSLLSTGETESDMLTVRGLLDVLGTTSAPTTTSVAVTLTECYGTFAKDNPVEGWVIGDFGDLFNVTDTAAVSLITATESATVPGEYALTFVAQDSTDVLDFRNASKDGFDATELNTVTFTIP